MTATMTSEGRVAGFRAAIAAGTYDADGSRLDAAADRMLDADVLGCGERSRREAGDVGSQYANGAHPQPRYEAVRCHTGGWSVEKYGHSVAWKATREDAERCAAEWNGQQHRMPAHLVPSEFGTEAEQVEQYRRAYEGKLRREVAGSVDGNH